MQNRMTALWLENNNLTVREREVPTPKPGEVLIRLHLAGICGTDLQLLSGYYPFTGIIGHEFVGEVVAAPDSSPWLGKRVVGEINVTCGDCPACRAGRPTHCERRTVLGIAGRDGVFCEYFTLPERNLHFVPDEIDDALAVFVEPLAAACQIARQIEFGREDRVLIIGAGRLGQLIAEVLSRRCRKLIVLAKHPGQETRLKKRGITTVKREQLADHSMDVVVEATGDPSGFFIAMKAVRPRGTIVLKSTYHGHLTANFSELVVNEITLLGSRCGPFDDALRLMSEDSTLADDMVEASYPLTEGLSAFEHAAKHGAQKILLCP